jgi:hypothetical protein
MDTRVKAALVTIAIFLGIPAVIVILCIFPIQIFWILVLLSIGFFVFLTYMAVYDMFEGH